MESHVVWTPLTFLVCVVSFFYVPQKNVIPVQIYTRTEFSFLIEEYTYPALKHQCEHVRTSPDLSFRVHVVQPPSVSMNTDIVFTYSKML